MPTTPRGRRTRQLIIERTSAVFDERGFAGSTLAQLVESTGLTRGAFYFHFESKEALAEAITLAQTEQWPALLAEVKQRESEPLRRMLVFAFSASTAFQGDLVMRAASRLMSERAMIDRELPRSYPFWIETLYHFLAEANKAGELLDLGHLVEPGWPPPRPSGPEAPAWVAWYADYLMATLLGLGQAASLGQADHLPERMRGHWRMVVCSICARLEYRATLLELIDDLTDQMRLAMTGGPALT
jgi:AcrR family transcriptional regulator